MTSRIAVLVATLASACCWSPPRLLVTTGSTDVGTVIDGLSSCRPEDKNVVQLDPNRPLILLVHGCNFSAGGFRTLARVFEAHGQQTLCFNYDDRARLESSSAALLAALEALETRLPGGEITVVGHSQGGLVARHALVRDRDHPLPVSSKLRIKLVTVSSPFAGISSSSPCGRTWLHILTLGVTVAICQGISGSKWLDIYPGSDFMDEPGTLSPAVTTHLKIVTDERGACQRVAPDRSCKKDDFVFRLDEQYTSVVDRDRRVTNVEVKAGHIEIVGERGTPPTKLISVLQAQQIMARTPPERRTEIAMLLKRLY